jgi:tetratricopeptide (TPR) repeat protein
MAIKGSLKEASLPDVIQLLTLGRRTGCLAVADRQNFGYIYFDEGRLTFASIVNRRDRIGDLLVRSGRIAPDQLQRAVDQQDGERGVKIGQILVDQGAITRQELESYIRLQIEEAVYYLFTWASGTFNFEAGVRPENEDFLVSINPESLLLEGARRVDEWSLIEKKIPSFDLIFAADGSYVADSGVTLSTEQQALLPLLDGTRDVKHLIDETGLAEFNVGQALYGLITAGFARRVGSSATLALPQVNNARVEEHRNLGVAFYKTGMLDEAFREFRRVADLRPAESAAVFYLGLIAIRQARWDDAVEALREAVAKGGPRGAALHNLGYALERLGRLEEAEAAYGEAANRAKDDPRILTGWAVATLKRGDVEAAAARLRKARDLLAGKPVPPQWYWAAGLAFALEPRPEAAIAVAREGAEAYPANAVLRNNLAVLLEAAGDPAAADEMLRAAYEEDPSLPQVSKNLGDLQYRAGRYDDAHEAYERAAKLDPSLGDDLFFKLGNIAFKRRDQSRARESWSRATELNPAHQLARANLDLLEAAP